MDKAEARRIAELLVALINSECDPQTCARLQGELPALELALAESVYRPSRPAHRILELINLLDWQVGERVAPLALQIEQLTSIPGITAEAYSGSGR